MCKKLGILCVIILVSLLFPFHSSAYSLADAFYVPQESDGEMIQVPLGQWQALKMELIEQSEEFELLKEKLQMLNLNSTEQEKQLMKLQEQIRIAKNSLLSANASLADTRKALNDSKESLKTLRQEIKKMEHKQKVIKRQRDLYMALAGALGVGLIIK